MVLIQQSAFFQKTPIAIVATARFCALQINGCRRVEALGKPPRFARGSVFHLLEPDIHQELYCLPEHLSAINGTWINKAAPLFRRRYYLNGSHAGFTLYMTDAAQRQEAVDSLREALRNAKGADIFRNLFIYAPAGKKDGIQLLPLAEVTAKDTLWNEKNVTRDDQLAAYRVPPPPQLVGLVPANSGNYGDMEKAAAVFTTNEVQPLQVRLTEVNV